MKIAYQTNQWGAVVGHPAGVTSIKDAFYLSTGDTLTAVQTISAEGFNAIEMFDGNAIQEMEGQEGKFVELLESLSLELVGLYSGANFIYKETLEDELSKITKSVDVAQALGCRELVVGGGAIRAGGIHEQDFLRMADALDRVLEIANQRGLSASFHPHLGTMVQSPDQLYQLMEKTSMDLCPDLAHIQAGGGDILEIVSTYQSRIHYVHLKDYLNGQFVPLGTGTVPVRAVIDFLLDSGFDGTMVVELDGYSGDFKTSVRANKEFLDHTFKNKRTRGNL